MKHYLALSLVFLSSFLFTHAQKADRQKQDNKAPGIFHTDVPPHPYDIILSRPTHNAVTVSVMCNENLRGRIQYGTRCNALDKKTAAYDFKKGEPLLIQIGQLKAGERYYYQFIYQTAPEEKSVAGECNFFQTQRPPNAPFTFTVQADSHLDENAAPEMYQRTLNNMAGDSADFLVDLGDTWMTDKYRPDYKASYQQYLAQRYYFGSLCKSSALFLTLGNHDAESSQKGGHIAADNMRDWATATRKRFYANPVPGDFYSGNTETEEGIGNPENYYAWQWGNALFIILDAFRYSKGNDDPWQRTLGDRQYHWLENTLRNSKAGFKFVFIHNLVGGADLKGRGRGGAEASKYFEWGGLDANGLPAFGSRRPAWAMPVHDLLVKYKVSILFHGHDHFFARQERDNLIYQLVPQPGAIRYANTQSAAEYGYAGGIIMNGPGYLRIKVGPAKATVQFVQTGLDARHPNGEIMNEYGIKPGGLK